MKYTAPEMKVVMFETEEVIVASAPAVEESSWEDLGGSEE